MCIKTKKSPEVHIASEDIKVIKVLSYREILFRFLFFNFRRKHCISPYKDKKYKLRKLYKSNISFTQTASDEYITGEGLYSFADEDSITTNFAFYPIQLHYNRGIFNAIIPKGARYYTDGKGEYCSDSLKILSYKKDLSLLVNYKTGRIVWT